MHSLEFGAILEFRVFWKCKSDATLSQHKKTRWGNSILGVIGNNVISNNGNSEELGREMANAIHCCSRSHITGRAKCCDNCNCEERREAARIYQKDYRRRLKERESGLGVLTSVPELPTNSEPARRIGEVGSMESAVSAAINSIPGARERFPDLCAMATRLGVGIDSPKAGLQAITSAGRQLARIMDDIRRRCPEPSPPVADQTPAERFMDAFLAAEGAPAAQARTATVIALRQRP